MPYYRIWNVRQKALVSDWAFSILVFLEGWNFHCPCCMCRCKQSTRLANMRLPTPRASPTLLVASAWQQFYHQLIRQKPADDPHGASGSRSSNIGVIWDNTSEYISKSGKKIEFPSSPKYFEVCEWLHSCLWALLSNQGEWHDSDTQEWAWQIQHASTLGSY